MLHLLTETEAAILDAAACVKFGELLNIEIEEGERRVSKLITAAQVAFVNLLRDEGIARLDCIIVHQGIPSQIEISGPYGTIKYKRKIRFSN